MLVTRRKWLLNVTADALGSYPSFLSSLFSSGQSNSKVTAHIGEDDFTVRINTDEEEYNVEVHLFIGI